MSSLSTESSGKDIYGRLVVLFQLLLHLWLDDLIDSSFRSNLTSNSGVYLRAILYYYLW